MPAVWEYRSLITRAAPSGRLKSFAASRSYTVNGCWVRMFSSFRVGSLTPGKRADLILVRTNDLNTAPFGNPAILLVQQAQPVNVDTVVIDGRILKHKGALTAIDAEEVIRKAAESFAAVRKRAGGP